MNLYETKAGFKISSFKFFLNVLLHVSLHCKWQAPEVIIGY